MLKRSHLTWIIVGVVAVSILIIIYLIASKKKGDFTHEDIENIQMSLKRQMEQELANSHNDDPILIDSESDIIPDQRIQDKSGAKGTIALFYSTGCPHCDSMMDDWNHFKELPEVMNSGLSIKQFEGAETRQHGVQGVPTIRYYEPGRFPDPSSAVKYNGDRSMASITRFALSHGKQV